MSDQDTHIETVRRVMKTYCRSKDVLQEHGDELAAIEPSLFSMYESLSRIGNPATMQNPLRRRTPRIHKEPIETRVSELEKRMDRQELATEELEFRANSGSSRDHLDEVVAYMKNAFMELEHVVGVHYVVLQDGTWDVVVIHTLDDKGKALETICKKSIEVQNAFHGVAIAPLVLHKDEVHREHLVGTRQVFLKTQQ